MSDQGSPADLAFSRPVKVSKLNPSEVLGFDETADQAERAAIASLLKATDVSKLRFAGTLTAVGKTDWQLDAQLGATVTQTCVVSLEPVKTRIETAVTRLFLPPAAFDQRVRDSEEDLDEIEELAPEIDLGQIAVEALSLALPDYPRAPGVTLEEAVFAGEGITPMTDDDAKPFAALAALRTRLEEE